MTQKHLFVCGAGRSGTTFLWRILNNSKQINLATEIHYFSSLYHNGFLSNFRKKFKKNQKISVKELQRFLNSGKHFGIYWDKKKHFKEMELHAFFNNKPITEKNIYQFLMEHDVANRGKNLGDLKYIGEKTPLNVFHLGQLRRWFPESTILFIYRDPIDVLRSEVNKREKPDYFLKKHAPLYSFGITVFVFIEWLLAALIALNMEKSCTNNFKIISYKSLNQQQGCSVQLICKAIGIEFDKSLYVYKKIGSSFKDVPATSHWQPPKATKALYYFFLSPLTKRLLRHTFKNSPTVNSSSSISD